MSFFAEFRDAYLTVVDWAGAINHHLGKPSELPKTLEGMINQIKKDQKIIESSERKQAIKDYMYSRIRGHDMGENLGKQLQANDSFHTRFRTRGERRYSSGAILGAWSGFATYAGSTLLFLPSFIGPLIPAVLALCYRYGVLKNQSPETVLDQYIERIADSLDASLPKQPKAF